MVWRGVVTECFVFLAERIKPGQHYFAQPSFSARWLAELSFLFQRSWSSWCGGDRLAQSAQNIQNPEYPLIYMNSCFLLKKNAFNLHHRRQECRHFRLRRKAFAPRSDTKAVTSPSELEPFADIKQKTHSHISTRQVIPESWCHVNCPPLTAAPVMR